jgi:hypothetical protein
MKLPIEKSNKQSQHMRTSKTGKVYSAGSGIKKEIKNQRIDTNAQETLNMVYNDFKCMHKVSNLLEDGKIKLATTYALGLDTAVRELLPNSFWNLSDLDGKPNKFISKDKIIIAIDQIRKIANKEYLRQLSYYLK